MFQRLVDMKTKAFSRYACVLVSLLSSAFSIFYIWQHEFGFSMHRHTTVIPASVPNDYFSGDDRDPVIEGLSLRRPPSVD